MKNLWPVLFLLLPATDSYAQDSTAVTPEHQLDFWIGTWELRWQDADGREATGTNRIVRELSDQVVCEYFQAHDGQLAGFVGRSWSVYDRNSKTWKQTWVDNQGGYLDFTGGPEGDTFIFQRQVTKPDGTAIHQKMVFYDIRADRFTWDWMRSTDGGTNWQLAWRINYTRQKP
ncbi:MAG: hypothetical protein EP344_06485 [Bacteroidetes bacterium]|nr:MAG: hypothetical protein EP344_06485 [Bacteroidota bacterium]